MAAKLVKPARGLRGELRIPGDKSISHRAAILGMLAQGQTRITGFLTATDCLNTLKACEKLGAKVRRQETNVWIEGCGLRGLQQPATVIDCGNSGTGTRLLAGVLAGQDFSSVITGDEQVRRRPMQRIITPLTQMGARIQSEPGGLCPLQIQGGKLKAVEYTSPVASAQIKSCILLAGLFAEGTTTVIEPDFSRDHTERMLRYFGGQCDEKNSAAGPGRHRVSVPGGMNLQGRAVHVPADISSAAFFLVAAAVLPESSLALPNIGLNPFRAGIISVLERMGQKICRPTVPVDAAREAAADLIFESAGRLRGTVIGGEEIPWLIDEIPIIAVAAALAQGDTVIRDAKELRVKETDRISVLAGELGKIGIKIDEAPDGMTIHGGKIRGGEADSHGDHRLAMSLAVAGLASQEGVRIQNTECVNTSFPEFWELMRQAGAEIEDC